MIKQKLDRIMYNIKRYGIFRTIKKIILRLFKIKNQNAKTAQELYQTWILQNEPDDNALEKQRKHEFEYEPKISVVVPMFGTDENFFLELFNSMLTQTYKNWELCLADGSEAQN